MGGLAMKAVDRLHAGDKLHLQYLRGRRVWWFENPHQVVSEKEIAAALRDGAIAEAGDSLFGLPMNSQTFFDAELSDAARADDPRTAEGDGAQPTADLFGGGSRS